MYMLNHQAFQFAEEHRRQLLRDAGADREDLIRHRLELHRSGPRSAERAIDQLPQLRRRLQHALIGWLAVLAIAGCGTLGSAGADVSSDRTRAGWHVAPIEGSPEAFSYPDDATLDRGLGREHVEERLRTWSGDDLAAPSDPAAGASLDLVDDTCLWRDCSAAAASAQTTTPRPAIGQRGRCISDGSICGLVPEQYWSEQ